MSDGGHRTTPLGYPCWDDYMQEIEAAENVVAWREYQFGMKAMRLAPSLAVYAALLEGQEVPVAALDPVWAERYGL